MKDSAIYANEYPDGTKIWIERDGERRFVGEVVLTEKCVPVIIGDASHEGTEVVRLRNEWHVDARGPGVGEWPFENTGWKEGRWLVVDTETTGIGPDAEIVELGAVAMERGIVVDHWSSLVKPKKPIPAEATAIHGIGDADVEGAPSAEEAGAHLCKLAEPACAIVGYNLVSYDQPILVRSIPTWRAATKHRAVIDPLVVVRMEKVGKWWPGKGRHKLTAVAARFGLDAPEPGMDGSVAHRAAFDCVMAGRVLWHLRGHLPGDRSAHAIIAREGAKQRAELDAYWAKQGQR